MEKTKKKEKMSFKERLEVVEAVVTILVSIMAIWGSLTAWHNGFWGKIKHIADHTHAKIVAEESMVKKDMANNSVIHSY